VLVPPSAVFVVRQTQWRTGGDVGMCRVSGAVVADSPLWLVLLPSALVGERSCRVIGSLCSCQFDFHTGWDF
jgi:hypothetical protein